MITYSIRERYKTASILGRVRSGWAKRVIKSCYHSVIAATIDSSISRREMIVTQLFGSIKYPISLQAAHYLAAIAYFDFIQLYYRISRRKALLLGYEQQCYNFLTIKMLSKIDGPGLSLIKTAQYSIETKIRNSRSRSEVQ